MKIKNISPGDIDLRDTRFRISPFFPLDRLVNSIREVGLIYPPVVTQRKGTLLPVTGWKRIAACKKLALAQIPVFLSAETDDLKCFKLALFENLTAREFDLIERAEIVSRLTKYGESEERIITRYLPLLGIPSTFDYYTLYKRIYRLNRKEKQVVSEKKMALPVVERLVQFTAEERAFLFPVLVFLGQNKQKELLELTKELSLKNVVSVEDIFESDEIRKIMQAETLSSLQKADNVRLHLKRRRFPLLSSKDRSFESAKKKLGWPKDIELSPTPFYEDSEVHIKFSFRGSSEYQKKISDLRRIAEQDDFSALLKTVSDE